MELVNQTPATAKVKLSVDEQTGLKYGIIAAKATFIVHKDGTTEIDTQDPFPLFDADEKTDLGFLPSDLYPRRDPVFEVILLGAAYAKGHNSTPHHLVELTVGNTTRRIHVFGDRGWETPEKISLPQSFSRIPLTYEYAFGGSCEAFFDDNTILDVEDPMNKYGRGFDAEKIARDLAAGFQAPEGFPKMNYQRILPNLENPEKIISKNSDTPEPYCWATIPPDIGFRMIEAIRVFHRDGKPPELEATRNMVYHRAHPDWIIDLPPSNTRITMKGMMPDNDSLTFDLPPVRIIADYVVGNRTGSRELIPQLLMLLPEENRFYLVYRSAFTVDVSAEIERSFRLRLEDGWY